MTVARCPVCAAAGLPWGWIPATARTAAIGLLSCPACGQVWKRALSRPSQELAVQTHTRDYTLADARWLLKRLPADIAAARLRVLDVGCWDGALLAALPGGWTRHGLEPQPQAAQRARARGLTVFDRPLESAALAAESYDLILMMDVLEHLDRPLAGMRRLATALVPGGRLVALTGNAATPAARLLRGCWYYLNYTEHVGAFTPDSLRALCAQAGLEVTDMRRCTHHSAHWRLTWDRLKRRLSRASGGDGGALALPRARAALVKLVASRLLRGRDHLLVVARKG
jgi:2-polyprenyl-3-methyl-5-hydroxy-6-metoxy-1,4-benzoquinol methylase